MLFTETWAQVLVLIKSGYCIEIKHKRVISASTAGVLIYAYKGAARALHGPTSNYNKIIDCNGYENIS